MTLYILLLLSFLAFLFFHYAITPRVKKSGSSNRLVAKLGKSGLLAILKYVYTFFFIATLTYALLILVTLVAGLSGAASSAGFESAITRIQGYRDALKVFKSFWTLALFAFIFIAVTVLLYRRLKLAIRTAVEEEKQRLTRERESGTWESLEPTDEMREVAKKIYTAQILFDRLDPSVLPQSKETQDARRELKEKIQELRAEWHNLDLERRAYRNMEARQGQTGSALRRKSRARMFFGSKGFLETLQSATRAVGHVALVLLFLSLVGVNTPLIDRALERRQVYLSDLQVKANQQEARESFAKLLAKEEDGGQPELNDEDEEALRDLSRHFERSFTSSHVWHPTYVYHDNAAQIRKDLIRDQIITIHQRNPSDGPDSPKGGGRRGPDDPVPGGTGPKPTGPDGGGGAGRQGTSDAQVGGTNKRPLGGDSRQASGSSRARPKTLGGGGYENPASTIGDPTAKKSTTITDGVDATFSSDDIRSRLGSDEWPRTGLGERFSSDVRRGIIGKSKKFWGRIKASLVAYADKFGEPFETLEFGKWAVGEMVGATVDSVWHHMPNMGEINEPVKGTIKAGIKDTAKKLYESFSGGKDLKEVAQRVYDLSFEQFMADLGEGMPLEQALGRVEAGVAGRPVASIDDMMKLRVVSQELLSSEVFENLEKSLKDNPPTLPEPAKDTAEARTAAQKLEKTLNAQGKTTLKFEEFDKTYIKTDTYENHYPGRSDALEKTPRETLLTKMRKKPTDPKISAELYAQSRDFSKLKLSTGLGGVLLGRAPDKSAGDVDFRDLSWTISGDEVRLRLKRADGSEVVLGPFRKDIVNNALVYVADDRKTVVTIKNSYWENNKLWRRILLHPALVDTALGHDIIEFDELVFKFTEGDPQRKASEQPIESQERLYDLAWDNRQLAIYEILLERRPDASDLPVLKAEVERLRKRIKILLGNRRSAAAIKFGLLDTQKITDPKTSLFQKYSVYFDPQLVRIMADCGGRSYGSGDIFGMCVQGQVRDIASSSIPEETVAKWLAPPVDPTHRSIAEERPFSVDAGLSFLSPDESTQPAAQLWPFEFRYEIAFPTNAPFLLNEEMSDAYRTPWEYLDLRTLIAEKVSQGVRNDARIRELFQRVREFAVLQRLFRISLDGQLGNQFPIEKLVGLTRATVGGNRGEETPRWEIKPIPEG